MFPAFFSFTRTAYGATPSEPAKRSFHYAAQFGNDELKEPAFLACDGNGRLYVVDMRGNAVVTFTAEGAFLRRWEIRCGDEAVKPSALALDGRGALLIADARRGCILKLSPSGELLASFYPGEENADNPALVTGIAVTAGGELFLADQSGECIYRHNRLGDFRQALELTGEASPGAMAMDSSGRLFVAHRWHDFIGVYSTRGRLVRSIGKKGSGDGLFREPAGLAFRRGVLYVADSRNHRVQIFDGEGRFLGKFGRPGFRAGEFENPVAVAALPSGNLCVVDRGNHRLQLFAPGPKR